MKRTFIFYMILSSSVLLCSCNKETLDSDSKTFIYQVVYETPNVSIDTLQTISDVAGKIIKRIYSHNDSVSRILYTAEFSLISNKKLKLNLKTEKFIKSTSDFSVLNSEQLYDLNEMGMISMEDLSTGTEIKYAENGQLKYTSFPNGCNTTNFNIQNGNVVSISEDWGCGKIYGSVNYPPEHIYEFSYEKNLNNIYQIDISENLEYNLRCPINIIKDFLGKPNQNMVSQVILRYWNGRNKGSSPKGTYDKKYHYSYKYDTTGRINIIELLDSDDKIIRREYYSSIISE